MAGDAALEQSSVSTLTTREKSTVLEEKHRYVPRANSNRSSLKLADCDRPSAWVKGGVGTERRNLSRNSHSFSGWTGTYLTCLLIQRASTSANDLFLTLNVASAGGLDSQKVVVA